MASSYHNIGDVWMAAESNYALRQYNTIDEARENLKKALTIELKVLGEHHQHLMTTYNKLAVLARKRHHLQESMDFYRKAHSITIRTFGRDSQETRDSYQQMSMLYFESGRLDKSSEYHWKALGITPPRSDPAEVERLNHLVFDPCKEYIASCESEG